MENDFSNEQISAAIDTVENTNRLRAYTGLDEDPEKAARALQLGRATGVNPNVIHDDMEGFEQEHKSLLVRDILDNNPQIRDYIRKNTLANVVSNDDYANLDEFTRTAKGVMEFYNYINPVRAFVKGTVETFKEAGTAPLGEAIEKTGSPFAGTALAAPMQILGMLGAPIGGLQEVARKVGEITGNESEGEQLARDIGGIFENEFGRMGEHPAGTHPEVDAAKAELNAKVLEQLNENLTAAQSVLTKERDPVLAEAYFKQHYETASVGISGDRILELYGDRVPSPDDGLLGWVPDMESQLEAAKAGDDVHIPLAKWMTHVDPALAKELMPDMRVWPGGITAREAQVPFEPRPVVDSPLAQARASLGTEPLFSIGDKKLTLERLPNWEDFHEYKFLDGSGKPVGEISLLPDPKTKEIYVMGINGLAGLHANSFGPSLIRDLSRQLKELYPEYVDEEGNLTISGHRVSGAREKAGAIDTHGKMKIKLSTGWDSVEGIDDFRQLLDTKAMEHFGQDIYAHVLKPEDLTPEDHEMGNAIFEAINRITGGKADFAVTGPIEWRGGWTRNIGGVYMPKVNAILVDLFGLNPQGVAHHEAIHWLKNNGFFDKAEWAALEKAAVDGGWLDAFEIGDRYKNLSEAKKLEEAIAEAFRSWALNTPTLKGELRFTPEAKTLFEKLKAFWEQVKAYLIGKGIDPEVVFEKIASGELAKREMDRAEREGQARMSQDNVAEGFGPEQPMVPQDAISRKVEKFANLPFDELKRILFDEQRALQARNADLNRDPTKPRYTAEYHAVNRVLWNKGIDPADLLWDKEKGYAPKFSIEDAREQLNHIRATVAGLDKKTFEQIQKLIAQRHEEDLAAALKRAEKNQKKIQTKEWKEQEAEVRKNVADKISNRPDVLADIFIGTGELNGKKIRQVNPIRAADLTPEQKRALPRRYYSEDGMPVDAVGRLFGFHSGETMVNSIIEYHKTKGDMTAKEHLAATIAEATQRQMERLHGKLDENIMAEAQDQALSETNLNLIAEEWQAAAMQAGVEVVDKDVAKAHALDTFAKLKVADVSFTRLQTQMLKHSRDAERDLINGDPASAIVRLQRKYELGLIAAEAKKLEKEQTRFDRTAKQFSKREVPSVEPEYTNFIHDILQRVGKPVRRSIQDVAKEIEAGESKSLADFVANKAGMLREVAVWDQLFDQTWRKPVEEMTVEEFRNVANSIKSLVFNGREERKIYRQGEAADLAEIKAQAIEAIDSSAKGEVFKPVKSKAGKVLRNFYVSHLQMENILNRWDAFDPKGIWNQYVMRDLIDGANQVDAWRKHYAKQIKDLPTPKGLDRTIDNPLFKDVDTGEPLMFTRKNLIAVMLNTGTGIGPRSNLFKLAKGYGLEPEHVMAWVHANATAEDWAFVRGVWDIFEDIKAKSDTMYRSLSGGVPAEDMPTFPIQTPHGEVKGGYYPVMFHDEMEGRSKKLMGKDPLEQDGYFRAATPAGYTKARTGYTAPLALDFDQMPGRIGQMLQDIGLRPAVINASKLFYDHDVRSAVRKHYGVEYRNEMLAYLKGVANAANQMEKSQQALTAASEFVRQNMITTLVGLNPGTVLKHGPTAAILSMREVGPANFAKAVASMFRVNEQTAESNWQFAMKHSLELQRRDRNWEESLYGATAGLVPGEKFAPWRQKIMQWSSKPVAMSDMISAVPTWLAAYEKEMGESGVHGDAVFAADRAVRRAHGSTASTNRTAIMRTANPWLTSVYNFFSDIMNRQMETIWKSGEILDRVKEGEKKAAMAAAGSMTASMFAYAVWPAIVEHMVSGQAEDEHEPWALSASKAMVRTAASSWVGVRDFVNWMLYGFDPQLGMAGTAMKELGSAVNDLKKDHPFRKDHAGRILQDGAGMIGAMTGMMPQQVGRTARYLHDVNVGIEHPRGPWEWLVGLRFGTTKGHSRTAEDYLKGKVRK